MPGDVPHESRAVGAPASVSGSNSKWFWVSIGFAALWALTVFAWYFSRRRPTEASAPAGEKRDSSAADARRRFGDACRRNDPESCSGRFARVDRRCLGNRLPAGWIAIIRSAIRLAGTSSAHSGTRSCVLCGRPLARRAAAASPHQVSHAGGRCSHGTTGVGSALQVAQRANRHNALLSAVINAFCAEGGCALSLIHCFSPKELQSRTRTSRSRNRLAIRAASPTFASRKVAGLSRTETPSCCSEEPMRARHRLSSGTPWASHSCARGSHAASRKATASRPITQLGAEFARCRSTAGVIT